VIAKRISLGLNPQNKSKYPMPIREWSEDDRPWEKLRKYGEHTLSNAELLAIMIRTGAPSKSAVGIKKTISQQIQGRPPNLQLWK